MNDDTENSDPIGALIRSAGLREPVPDMIEHRVRAEVRREWQTALKNRRQRWWSTAAAATVVAVAVLVAGVQFSKQSDPQLVAGSVSQVTGQVLVNGSQFDPRNATLFSGDSVATSQLGRAALSFADSSLRLDVDTVVELVDDLQLRLVQGGLYVDSGADPSSRAITVLTAIGSATDVGTQFEVRLEGDGLRVQVREGLVNVEQRDVFVEAQVGEAILLGEDGSIAKTSISPEDASWDWAEELAPEYQIENRSLLEFLTWAARETGRRLVFEDLAAERQADGELLQGSVAGMGPEAALKAVQQIVRIDYRIERDQILVEVND